MVVMAVNAYSTEQIKERLFRDNDTLYLYFSPLELIPEVMNKLIDDTEFGYATDCSNGFVADWRLIDSKIYLVNVFRFNSGTNLNSKLEVLLNKKFSKGMLLADWINKPLWCGKEPYYNPYFDYEKFFKTEYLLSIQNGVVVEIEKYAPKECIFEDESEREDFLLSRIDWVRLPKLVNRFVFIEVCVKTIRGGEITDAWVTYSSDSTFNAEVIKAAKQLPCISNSFYKGEIYGSNLCTRLGIGPDDFSRCLR